MKTPKVQNRFRITDAIETCIPVYHKQVSLLYLLEMFPEFSFLFRSFTGVSHFHEQPPKLKFKPKSFFEWEAICAKWCTKRTSWTIRRCPSTKLRCGVGRQAKKGEK